MTWRRLSVMYIAEAMMSIFSVVSDEISAEKSMASTLGVKPACLPTAWIRSIMNPCIWCVAGSRNENGTPFVSVPTFMTFCAAAGAAAAANETAAAARAYRMLLIIVVLQDMACAGAGHCPTFHH